MEIIQDGIGRGYTAKVDLHNRLSVYSTQVPRISFVSQTHGTGFMIYGRRDISVADTRESLMHLKYTGDVYLFIDKITFSTDDNSSLFEVYGDGKYVNGGTLISPVNINRSSSISSDSTCYVGVSGSNGELSVTTEDADDVLDVRLSSGMPTFTYNFDSSFILKKNTSIAIVGKSENIGAKLRASVFYFEEVDVSQ